MIPGSYFLSSLHGRLVLSLLALLITLGGLLLLGILKGSRLFYEEVRSELNGGVAEHIAKTLRPFSGEEIDEEGLKGLFMDVMVINPSLEVYLIDPEGRLLAYDAPEERIVRRAVDLEPVRRFLDGDGERSVRGDDPRSADGRKPISVHPVRQDGRELGYLYIILGGQDDDSAFAALERSYILRYAALLLAGAILISAVVGIVFVGRLTRPLRRLRGAMARFPEDLGPRAPALAEEDELRALERTYQAMARRIRDQMDELRQTDERRREFVANVSHDLRTPASAVQGYLETLILRRERVSEEEREQYLETALRQSRRLGRLVDQLFELAALEAQEGVPRKESFSLAELLQDIVQGFQVAAERREVTLRARFPYDLPCVQGDIGLIERALHNLIDNAIRHTVPGGEVVVSLAEDQRGVEIRISDAGPGIPAEELPRLFDRFYRVRQAGREDGEGAGLGLAITRRIVALHDSSITVESGAEAGTTFSFVLASVDAGDQGAHPTPCG